MARNHARPLSPHLQHWKWGVHMTVSIINRMMGIGLATLGTLALVWWISAAAGGEKAYDSFHTMAANPWAYIIWVGLSFAFFFHLCAGLRHFVLDSGAGFELKANRLWAWLTMAVAVMLTAIFWMAILWKGMH
jgi:succinate dehydrogenase / fumarate reductase, cytochrome b subunit